MILKSLWLTSFKNHADTRFEFGDRVNCVLGKNGVGKTNLLDAVYYLSFTKSALSSQDGLAVMHQASTFTILGDYEEDRVAIQFTKGKPKTLKINGSEAERLSDVIGKVPLVMILPDDTALIKEGSDERRKFFDGALCQFDAAYLQELMAYTKLLKQRNALLKQHNGQPINRQLLTTYDDRLIPLSQRISKRRAELIGLFLPFLEENYAALHDGAECPGISYQTKVGDDFEALFRANVERDIIMQRTLLGCHRDDIHFLLDGELIKKFGSQGQQKTFIISLKLALYDFLKENTGRKPLLLLDDIFDKLDDNRIASLVALLKDTERFQQIFITDARKDRSKVLFESLSDVKFIELATHEG